MPRPTRFARLLFSLIFVWLLALPARAETMRLALHAHLYSIDPVITMEYITRSHGYLVYDTLFALDENLEPQPQMVSDWSVSEDQLTWSFTLRPGQQWHDGTPVTAEDCVASLLRWGARDAQGWLLMSNTSAIRATAPDSFTITLRRPYPRMLEHLAKSSLNVPFMMPRRIAETGPFQPITDATGSGPYRFVAAEWVPGEIAVYEKNETYVPRQDPPSFAAGAKTAHFDRIELVAYSDPREALQALASDEVQLVETPSMPELALLPPDSDIKTVVFDPTGNFGTAIFNHQMPPFDNPGIRRAVLIAMGQTSYLSAAISDRAYWSPCLSIYPCHTTYSHVVSAPYYMRGDLQLAAKALAEAGYSGAPVVVVDPVDSPVLSGFTRVTVDLLGQLGMNVVHKPMSWRELRDAVAQRTGEPSQVWNMFHTWWTADDLSDPMHILFSGDPRLGWIGWPDDPELEALRAQFVLSEDEAARKALALRIQDKIVQNGNFAVLGQFIQPLALRSSLGGLQGPFPLYYQLAPADQ
ncbi:ABC transporter substrate-binding protein [Marimonas lutisalis]|uniref:ABC transporter substrate-binding protein n=1 Tax=Marimonas lutisalis TaxID=2545756 RepID=UPI0010F6F6D5|nr:ABC transporter substrate-binding protein [Marimonas lutisalis]